MSHRALPSLSPPQQPKDISYATTGAMATDPAGDAGEGEESPQVEVGIELGVHPDQRIEHVGLLAAEPAPPRPPRRSYDSRRAAATGAIGDPFECVCTLLRVPKAVGRNYVLYQRNSCLVTVGPHWSGLLFTIGLIITSTYFFIRNVCLPSVVASSVAMVFCIVTLGTLLMTGCSNPGFVVTSVPESQARRKYCDRCQIYTAPGTAHCEDCNCCIEQLDHHCPWTGHCIGRRNMSYFVTFNCTWVMYILFVFFQLMMKTKTD